MGSQDSDAYLDRSLGPVRLRTVERFAEPQDQVHSGVLVAQMSGSIVRIAVRVGDVVSAGQPIMWLEAMKMQQQIGAPGAGAVTELRVSSEQQVEVGTVLAVIDTAAGEAP